MWKELTAAGLVTVLVTWQTTRALECVSSTCADEDVERCSCGEAAFCFAAVYLWPEAGDDAVVYAYGCQDVWTKLCNGQLVRYDDGHYGMFQCCAQEDRCNQNASFSQDVISEALAFIRPTPSISASIPPSPGKGEQSVTNSPCPDDSGSSIWGLLVWVVSPLIMAIVVLLVFLLLVQIVRMKRKLQRSSLSSCAGENEKVVMVIDDGGLPLVLVKCSALPKIENSDL